MITPHRGPYSSRHRSAMRIRTATRRHL